MIITIDGPAGAGKSTIARELAQRLKISYLDTGAMYRALTLKALRSNTELEEEGQLVRLAQKTSIQLTRDGENDELKVFLDGEDVSEEIRAAEVTNNVFYIAQAPRIREIMVQWQREIGEKESVVVEGRDIGTVVFPNATYKFYLDADFTERTRRRIKQLEEKGRVIDAQVLQEELRERDNKDFTRKVGPLKKAGDAIIIDSTNLSIEGVVDKIIGHIKE